MTVPTRSGYSAKVASTGDTVTVAMTTKQEGTLLILYAELFCDAADHNESLPVLPPGFQVLDSFADAGGARCVAWKRSTGTEANPVVSKSLGSGAGVLSASLEIYDGVDFRDPGFLEIPGTAGNYATITRTAVAAAPTYVTFAARVSFNTLGASHWIAGWGSSDVGFGVNVLNQPVMFLTNTVGGIIGNAPAAIDVPGLSANRKIWLRGTVIASTANCSYWYSYDDVENEASVHWVSMGAGVPGSNFGTTVRTTNSTTVIVGHNSTLSPPSRKNVYAFSETSFGTATLAWHYGVDGVLPAGHTIVGVVPHRAPTVGTSSPIEDFDFRYEDGAVSDPYFYSTRVYGTDRLVVGNVYGDSFGDAVTKMISGPEGWAEGPERSAKAGQLAVQVSIRTRKADADTADTYFTIHPYFIGPWVFTGVIRPAPPPAAPPSSSPQPPRLVLGCPTTYTTWITDGGYRTTIEQLHWSAIAWERVLDSISSATVTIPDEYGGVNCLAKAGGLEPWRYGLLIERDDQQVWSGPIITVARQGPAIQVSAADVFARYQKRFLIRDAVVDYDATDSALLFRDIITTHAATRADRWRIEIPFFEVGVPITRTLKPREFKYAWDLLSELLNSSIDAYVMNGVLYVWDPKKGWRYHFQEDQQIRKGQLAGPLQAGPPTRPGLELTMEGTYNSNYDLVYGTFTEESFATQPSWTLDGMGQTNFVVVPAADTGEAGFRSYDYAEDGQSQVTYGVLDFVDPDPIESPQDTEASAISAALAVRAKALADLRSYPPITVEGGTLSQTAPIDIDNLRPGAIWKLDIYDAGFGQLLSLCRVRRISVSVQRTPAGVSEAVTPTLEPPGSSGSQQIPAKGSQRGLGPISDTFESDVSGG